jgi:hypothetical protein
LALYFDQGKKFFETRRASTNFLLAPQKTQNLRL